MDVLVIAVHPDDETLGCGGTLFRHVAQGDKIHWLIATSVSTEGGFSTERCASRAEEIDRVSKLYNFHSVHQLELNTMHVDEYTCSHIIAGISSVVKKVQPTIVYLPFKGDPHSDHRIIFDAAYSCTKNFRYPSIRRILMMEVPSETDFAPSTKEDAFIPNFFIDISDYIEQKKAAMQIFSSELGNHPFPRSLRNIEAWATVRGATAGCEYAEAFMLLKEVQ